MLRLLRWETVRGDQFRAEQADSLGSHLDRFARFDKRPNIGKHLYPDPVSSHTWAVPVDLQIPLVSLCCSQTRLYLGAARLVGSDCHRPALSINDERRTLVNLGKRTIRANHSGNAYTLCHDCKVTRCRSRLRDDCLEEFGIQPNRFGRSEVLRDKNRGAIEAYLQRYPPQLCHDTSPGLTHILCASRQVRVGKLRELSRVVSCNTRDCGLGSETRANQVVSPLF